jgi:hypothetical protein
MKARGCLLLGLVILLSGCISTPPKDFSEFHKCNPRSILVLPPINESAEVIASYSLLSTVTRPLAELGYYVVPVAMTDAFLKENGLALPPEMHQAPLDRLREAFGADAVLYITINKYGSKYQLVASNTYVYASAKLVDPRSGTTIWAGQTKTFLGGQAGLIQALVEQLMNKLVDQAHQVAILASNQLLATPGQGLPRGPLHPDYNKSSAR